RGSNSVVGRAQVSHAAASHASQSRKSPQSQQKEQRQQPASVNIASITRCSSNGMGTRSCRHLLCGDRLPLRCYLLCFTFFSRPSQGRLFFWSFRRFRRREGHNLFPFHRWRIGFH
ncbi:exo-alpha-sialidase, partial [Trypanosoma cruzi]